MVAGLKRGIIAASVIAVLFGISCFTNRAATEILVKTQPDWYFLNLNSYKKFGQMLSVSFGFRRLFADFEYISFLQYYGNREHAHTGFKDLYRYIDDITDADPHFTFAYTYGGAALAFNLERYDEAISIIKKGLRYNPEFWQLRLYLGAIIYKELDDKDRYIGFLEDAARFSDRPAMIDRILGNIYEQYKTPDEAAAYWVKVYGETKDTETREHAYNRLLAIIEGGGLKNPGNIVRELEE